MKLKIIATTDNKYIGEIIDTDLLSVYLPSGELFSITNRMRTLNNIWKIWNANYIIEAEEIEESIEVK